MKKLLTLLLALTLVFALFACGQTEEDPDDEPEDEVCENHVDEDKDDICDTCKEKIVVKTMTYEEFTSAAIDSKVAIESYVQAKQSWWDNKATFYLQDEVGAYLAYEMPCTEEEYASLTVGTKIKVVGYKAEWSGEIEIADAKFEILEAEPFVATPTDVTALLGTDDLIKKQNMLVSFKDMTVKAVEYKNNEPGDDIYVTLTKGEADYDFCVELYLTGPHTDVYKAVQALAVGDVIDVEGFLYWYNGMNPHITAITKK